MDLNWHAIRPLNGSINSGFEELCVQLARTENPPNAKFFRKGTPDGGVECYNVFPDGSEWGWQAKFFDKLEEPQLQQIDKSIKTALEKHPRLVRYYVCVNKDRSDGRVTVKKAAPEYVRTSIMDRWNTHVEKWTKWASDRGMKVEFIYWGSSELLEKLTHPEHIGRRKFWFDIQGFGQPWFTARLEEALRSAGPRYTPEIHVDLPIADDFEAFGRTDRFFNQTKTHARDIRERLAIFNYSTNNPTESAVRALGSKLSSQVQAILTEIQIIEVNPVGELPFREIAGHIVSAETTAGELEPLLLKHEQADDTEHLKGIKPTQPDINPLRKHRDNLIKLSSSLREMREVLRHAEEIAGRNVLILKGDAGTGKTHLLCDVARQRIKDGRPTVLLMGQRFLSTDDPWVQTLQQLDLTDLSAEEFIGALEAAAQAADCRALVMVDAINEGKGRDIWPSNMAAFVARLERSPWIGVVFSVRSSYEEIIIPENVRAQAVFVTHQGFKGQESDAMRTFFLYYGIELPSTPLLAPEYHNPLYLKTLCEGLHKSEMQRLPRGINGITATFDLYLDAINKKLAKELDFHPKKHLVHRALETFAKAMVNSGERWLPLEKAEEIVNAVLPRRDYDSSLYHNLVSEGVFIEDVVRNSDTEWEDAVFIAYERLADHLTAKVMLDTYLESTDPATAFTEGEPFAFLYDKSRYVAPGLLEAMCIHVPERIGRELVTLAPEIAKDQYIGRAFRQSIIWRDTAAFSEDTRTVLDQLIRTKSDLDETLDMLLTVAALPGHPYNANYLDWRLRKDHMPDRDAWWSIYLHHAWGRGDAVDRLVDWASSIPPDASIEEEVVDLCAITLSWMLTTSNRFLRDRATKALVSLLTGRLDAAARLVKRFDDVDDPYVTERVYAVAYGVAMRSRDPKGVGVLAQCVYDHVFASGTPPTQILLRDYARGVIERALYLQANLDIVVERIRPPYKSEWPAIPTEDEIKPLLPDLSRGFYSSGDLEWARNRIGISIMDDDFAWYVIGTNGIDSSSNSRNWISLQLEDAPWQSLNERIAMLQKEFSTEEKAAWKIFQSTDSTLKCTPVIRMYDRTGWRSSPYQSTLKHISVIRIHSMLSKEGRDEDSAPEDKYTPTREKKSEDEVKNAKKKRDAALTALRSVVSKEHAPLVEGILSALANHDKRHPVGFDLWNIQRYILWRVFDLGWTIERFGKFDRYSIGARCFSTSKAERIGKKYQWMAYHEIVACVADHYQYREYLGEKYDDRFYDGPWQNQLRDIDPSCTLRTSGGGTSWNGNSRGWWGPSGYNRWEELSDSEEWVRKEDDLPNVGDLFVVLNPEDGTRWLNVQGLFIWRQPAPPDQETRDTDMREISYICTGYLVHAEDVDAFEKWAEDVRFWGWWMPEPPKNYDIFLGEHGWSPASRYFRERYYRERGDGGWVQPSHGCPVMVKPIAFNYSCESNTFDCSIDERYTLRLPTSDIIEDLGLQWSGNAGDYLDSKGRLAAFDPIAQAEGPDALLIREDILKEYLARENLALCWVVIGEKRVIEAGFDSGSHSNLLISGAYVLRDTEPVGSLHCKIEEASQEKEKGQDSPRS